VNKVETVLENIKSRRSVRKYSNRRISEDDLNLILEAGRWAPSGANAQPWHFIVVRGKATIKQLSDACYYSVFKSRHVGEASVVIVILGNPAARSATYIQDCTIAGANMTLMANALGIGSCWIGAFEDDTVMNILTIPDQLKIVALISFGYAVKQPRVTPRLELKDIVHYEHYGHNKPKLVPIRRATRSGPLSVFRQIIRVLINRRV